MGKDTPFILEGDGEADVIVSLVEDCGINYEDYARDNNLLTRERFEACFEKLLQTVQSLNHHVAYLIFGTLILKTGSKIPEDLRKKLIEAADWKKDREKYIEKNTDDKEFLEMRKNILIDFQQKIKNYRPGQIIRIY